MNILKNIFSYFSNILKYIQEHFKAMLFLLLLFFLFWPTDDVNLEKENLYEIKLIGEILDSTELVSKIDDLYNNDEIKGVLLNVDSPGGAVSPSVEIAYAIKRLKEKKPVVVYASGTIASGSYYASIWADKIIANPGSMIGSIGVIMQGADLSGIMEKIGIKTQVIQAGKYKQIGTPNRPWKKYEVAELEKVIRGTYDMFSKDVATARGLDFHKRDDYANAHIFTSKQAKDVGLIDMVGVKYVAKSELIKLSKVKKAIWNKEDKFDKFIKKISTTLSTTLYIYFPNLSLR